MELHKLSTEVANVLNERINDEYTAHYFYRQVANYCENAGYLKAAAFFKDESADELAHAESIQKYLTDWNMMPVLSPVSAPEKVSSLVDAIEKAYAMEYELYEAYEAAGKLMLQKDLCTFNFIQGFMEIQRKAVAEYATLLNRLQLIDNKDKNWIFEFEHNSF
jgi:ferritin